MNKQNGKGSYFRVFNINKKKMEVISKEHYNLNSDLYYLPNDKALIELAETNTKNIIKAINENGLDKYYNIGQEPIEYIRDDYMKKGSWLGSNLYHNPYGLWFGCGSDWQHYISGPSQWAYSTHLYEIEISDSVKKISSIEELKKFIEENKNDNETLKVTNVLNWEKIKEKYDGVVVCPYLGSEIWGNKANEFALEGSPESIQEYVEKIAGNSWKTNIMFLAEWYRHWETGSGVVWRASGIKNFILIERINTFDNLTVDDIEKLELSN